MAKVGNRMLLSNLLKRASAIAVAALIACALCLLGCTATQSSGITTASASSTSAASSTNKSSSTNADNSSEASIYGSPEISAAVTENGEYSDKDRVAAYIHEFGHLPSNYISKTKARKAGWDSEKGNLWDVLPGMSIGGSDFYNDEGLLPDAKGRHWTECDINYTGGYRGAERIVFSNDGLIFYTPDHYNTFEQLY